MSYSIEKAQQELLGTNFLDENAEKKAQYKVLNSVLDDYVVRFLNELNKQYNARNVVASGDLINNLEVEIYENGRIIKLPYYYDFPNKGVKGWGSDKNAATSPYQFRTKGMSEQGRQSIREYIESGKAKSTITKSYSAYGGVEKKSRRISAKADPIEQAVNRAVWMIKKYGIKTNPYFDIAYDLVFKDFTTTVSKATGLVAEIFVKANLEQANKQQTKIKGKKK